MAHIYTYDEIKKEFEDRDYILLTDHKLKCNEKYEYICKKHQDKGSQFIDWGHFHCSAHGCSFCGRKKCDDARRKDLSEYNGKELAESKGFEYVGMSRHDKKIWVQFICPKHRQYGVQEMPYNNMKRVVIGCQHCIGRNDDEEEVLKEIHDINPFLELLDSYQGRTKRIRMYCTRHNMVSHKTPYEAIIGKGCYMCGLEKLSQQAKLPEGVFSSRLNNIYPHIKLTDGYNGVTELANFHCEICNSDFIDYPAYVERRGCPVCDGFSVERKIGVLLTKYDIQYKPQYSFNDCKDQRALPFDFYLPKYNLLIEYDGQQHYRPVNFGGISDEEAYENFKITQLHDSIKNNYCDVHNIPLLRIPYWEQKNIEQIILDKIKSI